MRRLLIFILWLFSFSLFAEPQGTDGLIFAMQSAVALNPRVKSAMYSLSADGINVEAAKAQRFPTVTFQTDYSRTNYSDETDNNKLFFLRVQQPLWTGGRITGNINIADSRHGYSTLELMYVKRTLAEDTAATYAAVRGIRNQLAIADENVADHSKLLELITKREIGQIASKADVLLAKSHLARAMSQQEEIRGQLSTAKTSLRALTMNDIEGIEPVPENIYTIPKDNEIVDIVIDASASVKLAVQNMRIAGYEADLAKADIMPSLSLRMDKDVYQEDITASDPKETTYSLVLEGSFEGSGISAVKRFRAADKRVSAAEKDIEAVKNDIRRTVWSLMNQRAYLINVKNVNVTLVQTSYESLQSILRQYDVGRKTWLDVLNTQQEYATARQSQEQTNNLLLQTELRLAVQLGLFDKQTGVLK